MRGSKELALIEFEKLAKLLPEQRLGQIIYNYIIAEIKNQDIFYLEDTELLNILSKKTKEIENARIERRLKKALDDPETRTKIFDLLIDEELI